MSDPVDVRGLARDAVYCAALDALEDAVTDGELDAAHWVVWGSCEGGVGGVEGGLDGVVYHSVTASWRGGGDHD